MRFPLARRLSAWVLICALATITAFASGCAAEATEEADDADSAVVGVNDAARRAEESLERILLAAAETSDADRAELSRVSDEIATFDGARGTYHVHIVWPTGADPYGDDAADTCAVISDDAVFFYNVDGGVAWASATSPEELDAEAHDFAAAVRGDATDPASGGISPQGWASKVAKRVAQPIVDAAGSALRSATRTASRGTKAVSEKPTKTRAASGAAPRQSELSETPSKLRGVEQRVATGRTRATGTKVVRPRTEAEIAAITAFNRTQRSRAEAQVREAIRIGRGGRDPVADPERYGQGTTGADYARSVRETLSFDPHRYERAASNLTKPLYGMKVSVNARGDDVVYVYHGGAVPEGAAFDGGRLTDSGVLGRGLYFSTDESLAVEFARRSVERSGGTARVIRLEIPVRDIEGLERIKLLATPHALVHGSQFDGAMILNVTGWDSLIPGIYGAFTDMAYANRLVQKTVRVIQGPG